MSQEQAVPADKGWKIVRYDKSGGPIEYVVLYWIHREGKTGAATPIGVMPLIADKNDYWLMLKDPDGFHYVPGRTTRLNTLALHEWIQEKRNAKP